MPDPKLRVPGNLVPFIQDASIRMGVPFEVIAAVLQQHSRLRIDPEDSDLIYKVAAQLAAIRDRQSESLAAIGGPISGNEPRSEYNLWIDIATLYTSRGKPSEQIRRSYVDLIGPDYQIDEDRWTYGDDIAEHSGTYTQPRFPVLFGGRTPDAEIGGQRVIYKNGERLGIGVSGTMPSLGVSINDAFQMFKNLTGRQPSEEEARRYVGLRQDVAEHAISALPEAEEWRGFEPKYRDTRRWADEVYMHYTGQSPTLEQVKEIITRGYTRDTLKKYLRSQPYGEATRGQFEDIKQIAEKYAMQYLGREADEGEANYLITNNLTSPDQVQAYYEQLKTRIDTGDPAFAWAAHPKHWRFMQNSIQRIWDESGLTTEVDPHFVNAVITNRWTKTDIQRSIDAMEAPGFIKGVTVGAVNGVRKIAEQWKGHWYPDEPVTNDELQKFIGLDPDAIRKYYGSMPARARTVDTQIPPETVSRAPWPMMQTLPSPARVQIEPPERMPIWDDYGAAGVAPADRPQPNPYREFMMPKQRA